MPKAPRALPFQHSDPPAGVLCQSFGLELQDGTPGRPVWVGCSDALSLYRTILLVSFPTPPENLGLTANISFWATFPPISHLGWGWGAEKGLSGFLTFYKLSVFSRCFLAFFFFFVIMVGRVCVFLIPGDFSPITAGSVMGTAESHYPAWPESRALPAHRLLLAQYLLIPAHPLLGYRLGITEPPSVFHFCEFGTHSQEKTLPIELRKLSYCGCLPLVKKWAFFLGRTT